MRQRKIRSGRFKPAWWLPGGHLQTLWPHFFRCRPDVHLTDERLELDDGDFVDLCLTKKTTGPVVVIFHGLEGCIDSQYVKPMLSAIAQQGWQGVFMHFRGCSGVHNRLARSYHSGDTGDIAFLIDHLQARFQHAPIAAIGYSLGGNALLKYLGESKRGGKVNGAVAVSVPYLLAVGARKLDSGLSKIYQWYLLGRLQKKIADKFGSGDSPIDLDQLAQFNTFFRFDDNITAPLHGFDGVDDYYRRSSSRQYLQSIDVPTLLIQARDDPFMTEEAIPHEEELSRHVLMELSDHGGHVGFVGGRLPWRPLYWLEQRITDFLGAVFN